MKRAVVFGAGGIGRGFLGPVFAAAGWRVTFVDVSEALVARLNSDGSYRQIVVHREREEVIQVDGVDALLISANDDVVAAVADADMVATAVGASNLPPVAVLLAEGLEARARAGRGPLDMLICENLHDAPKVLRALIDEEGRSPLAEAGLARTSIGRMVPVQIPNEASPTDVRVEPYSFLPYEAAALVGPPPEVEHLVAVTDSFDMYADRKLYLHNMGHCMLAYLGESRGLEFIWESVEQIDLRYFVRSAMTEAAGALSVRYGVPLADLLRHVDDLLARFRNHGLGDTNARVGRDPLRKMQPGDRMLGSYALCLEAGVTPSYVALAVALGIRRLADEPDWDLARATEFAIAGLPDASPDGEAVIRRLVDMLDGQLDPAGLLDVIDDEFRVSRVV